jgi:UDP-galactopyranose mutase
MGFELVMYDYVIVGAGLYGSIFAFEANRRGFKCLVIDSRNHIGGNCYTKEEYGINVHVYGPHIFHCNSKEIWDYVNQFAQFNNFIYQPKAFYYKNLYSLPFNLNTFNEIYGHKTPQDVKNYIDKLPKGEFKDLESWCISQIGKPAYEYLVKDYTKKQWNKDPKDLPSSIIKRLPVRYTFDNNYFNDRYQGIPIGGYTKIFEKLLKGIEVKLQTEYTEELGKLGKKIIYTGPIDKFFDYKLGILEYRSLRFEHEHYESKDLQGTAVINHTSLEVPYTRTIEHKHFENSNIKDTVFTKEYPDNWDKDKTPYYPINTERNDTLYKMYKGLSEKNPKVSFKGRLGTFGYYDMHQIIGMALKDVSVEFARDSIIL